MSAEAGAPAASSALSSSVTSAPPSGAKSGTPSVRTIASVIDEASSGSRSTEVPAWDQWGNSGVPAVPEGSRITVENLRISDEGEEDGHAPAVADSEILDDYEQLLKNRTSHHVGYPYNLDFGHSDLLRFLKYSVNNLGDPWLSSNYKIHSRPFELAVLAFFARLWKIDDGDYWGYVTTCGTEGNLHGILTGREVLPDAVLYASCESHYSIMKAARFYRMDMVTVPTLYTGEIDYDKLQAALEANKDKPAIINVNIGTTVKGAVDDLDRVLRILSATGFTRDRFYIHCDGALFALMLPFVQFGPEVSFRKPIDSVAVSGHKFLGCPMPCGVVITRREHLAKLASHIEYVNSMDTTIVGSRNGQAPLFMWYTLRKKGVAGLRKDTSHCLAMAQYLRDRLRDEGVSTMLNDLSSTVVLERPASEDFVRKWQLACVGGIAHVVVMPNVSEDKIDRFVEELRAVREANPRPTPCVREHIGRFCVCDVCVERGKSIATQVDHHEPVPMGRAPEERANGADEAAAGAAGVE